MLTIEVHGFPTPQGSKKAWVNQHTGRAQMREQTSGRLNNWRQDVKAAAFQAIADREGTGNPFAIIGEPVAVETVFRFPRPKAHYRTGRNAHLLRDDAPTYPANRTVGDIEKLLRSTHDALTTAGVWIDDALVADVHAVKVYVDDHAQVGATIAIRPLDSVAAAVSSPVHDTAATDPTTAQGVLL